MILKHTIIYASMRVLICPDSFKGSLTAAEAAAAITRGVRRVIPHAGITALPLADGGEGTLEALEQAGRKIHWRQVRGPLGRAVRAKFLTLRGGTAVVEMAQAAGLTLIPHQARNPMRTTTYGVGQLMLAAVMHGCRRIIVTLGGSATVDGGCGMAQALGARLLDARGKPIPPGGAGLQHLATIDVRPLRRRLKGVTVLGATDVRNPLLGLRGAARVFGPQKGATPAQVAVLERGLANFTRVCRRDLGVNPACIPGAGAAGGMGAGLLAFTGARLESGAGWLFDFLRFDAHLKRADLVLTGEGNLDTQTRMGKLIAHVVSRARRHHVRVIAYAGQIQLSRRDLAKLGLAAAYSLSQGKLSKQESFRRAAQLLEARVAQTIRASSYWS